MHIYLKKGTLNPGQDRLLKNGTTVNVASQMAQCILTEEETRVIELSLLKIVESDPKGYTKQSLWREIENVYHAVFGALEYGSERCEKLHELFGALAPDELVVHNPPLPFEEDVTDDEIAQNVLPFSKKGKQ